MEKSENMVPHSAQVPADFSAPLTLCSLEIVLFGTMVPWARRIRNTELPSVANGFILTPQGNFLLSVSPLDKLGRWDPVTFTSLGWAVESRCDSTVGKHPLLQSHLVCPFECLENPETTCKDQGILCC